MKKVLKYILVSIVFIILIYLVLLVYNNVNNALSSNYYTEKQKYEIGQQIKDTMDESNEYYNLTPIEIFEIQLKYNLELSYISNIYLSIIYGIGFAIMFGCIFFESNITNKTKRATIITFILTTIIVFISASLVDAGTIDITFFEYYIPFVLCVLTMFIAKKIYTKIKG